ncbi:MAG: hypothetical protein KME08_19300 [Aphanothece sp. CMT-3BRIN-NPC111]|nr:hypothetical protein [Aphanothece sp. CMT-3BRIN-NPC111]
MTLHSPLTIVHRSWQITQRQRKAINKLQREVQEIAASEAETSQSDCCEA